MSDGKGQGDQFREYTQNLFDSIRDAFRRSADEVVAGAKVTRTRIDVFQLRRDREHFLLRLGEEAYRLIEAGQLNHPELDEAAGRVRTIDDKILEYEAEITAEATPEPADAPDEPAPEPKKKATKKAEPKKKAAKKAEPEKKTAKKAEPKKKTAKKAEPKKKAAKKKAAPKKKTTKKSGGTSKKTL